MSHARRPLLFCLSLVLSVPALGQEALEPSVVRNRLFTVHNRAELSAEVSSALVPRLVDHYNFTVAAAYNFKESWALELRVGYALSRHSNLAGHLARDLLKRDPGGPDAQVVVVNDLSGLWEMKGNLLGGVRWAPLYGKISLLADTSVHFQAYLWLGGGVGAFHRQSVVYCSQVTSQTDGSCGSWLEQDRTAPMGSAALGMRFFAGHRGAVRLEIRNYLWKDSYLINVDRAVAQSGQATGQPAASPGLTNLVMLDLGFTFFL